MAAMKKEELFVRFTEFNDHEGETWHRFISVNDPNLSKLQDIVSKLDDLYEDEESPYGFKMDADGELVTFPESKVDVFCDDDDDECGYYDKYGVSQISELNLEKPDNVDSFEFYDDQVYKLGWAK